VGKAEETPNGKYRSPAGGTCHDKVAEKEESANARNDGNEDDPDTLA